MEVSNEKNRFLPNLLVFIIGLIVGAGAVGFVGWGYTEELNRRIGESGRTIDQLNESNREYAERDRLREERFRKMEGIITEAGRAGRTAQETVRNVLNGLRELQKIIADK